MSRMRDALEKLSQTGYEAVRNGAPEAPRAALDTPTGGVSDDYASFAQQLTSPAAPIDWDTLGGAPSLAQEAFSLSLLDNQPPAAPELPGAIPQPTELPPLTGEPIVQASPAAPAMPAPAPVEPIEDDALAARNEPPLDLRAFGLAGPLNSGRTLQIEAAVASLRKRMTQERVQVLLVTGAGPTSSTADLVLRLTVGLCQRHVAALLVDGDVAGRWLSMRLGMLRRPGWTDAKSATAGWAEIFRPTTSQGLVICPVGTRTFGDPQAQFDPHAAFPWRQLASEENVVLVFSGQDSAAFWPALAKACDAGCLIADFGRSTKRQIAAAHAQLKATGLTLLGCVAIG